GSIPIAAGKRQRRGFDARRFFLGQIKWKTDGNGRSLEAVSRFDPQKDLLPASIVEALMRLYGRPDREQHLPKVGVIEMNRTVLLAGTAALALIAVSALAGSHPSVAVKATNLRPIQSPGSTLYNQN